MKKKFVSYLVLAGAVFGLAIVGSCKDYEYDVLQDQINGLNGNTQADVTTLQNKINAIQTEVNKKLNNPSTTAQLSDSLSQVYSLLSALSGGKTDAADIQTALNNINQKVAGAASIADAMEKIEDYKFLWSDSLFTAYENAFYAKNLADKDSVNIDSIFGELAKLVAAQDTLVGRIELTDSLKNLEERYKAADSILADQIKDLYEQVEQLRDSVSKLYLTEKKRITSLYVQGAMNPIFGSFALPAGIRTNVLAAHAGNILNDTRFPIYADDADNSALIADTMAISKSEYIYLGLTANKVKQGKAVYEEFKQGTLMSDAEDNAGRIFITVNPNEVEIDSTYTFKFVTSDGNETPATIGKFVPSKEKMTFGWTRAVTNSGFYEAPVKIAEDDVKALAPEFAVSKDQLVDVAKNILTPGGINLLGVAKAVSTLAQTKLAANAVRVEWADSLGDHSVTSQYDVAVTAFEPLSFNAMTPLREVTTEYRMPTISPLDEISITMPQDIHVDLDDIQFSTAGISSNISFGNINIDKSGVVQVTVDVPVEVDPSGQKTYDVQNLAQVLTDVETALNNVTWADDANTAINNVIGQIKTAVDNMIASLGGKLDTEINDMLKQVENAINKSLGGFNDYFDQMNDFVGQINNVTETFNVLLRADGSALLAPWIMYKGTDGSFHPMSNDKNNPTVFKKDKGGIVLYLTSFNAELLAPAYKKFVTVTKFEKPKMQGGKVVPGEYQQTSNSKVTGTFPANYPEYYNTVLEGQRYAIPFDPTEPGRYTIYYSALDYSGFVAAERFYVVVEE